MLEISPLTEHDCGRIQRLAVAVVLSGKLVGGIVEQLGRDHCKMMFRKWRAGPYRFLSYGNIPHYRQCKKGLHYRGNLLEVRGMHQYHQFGIVHGSGKEHLAFRVQRRYRDVQLALVVHHHLDLGREIVAERGVAVELEPFQSLHVGIEGRPLALWQLRIAQYCGIELPGQPAVHVAVGQPYEEGGQSRPQLPGPAAALPELGTARLGGLGLPDLARMRLHDLPAVQVPEDQIGNAPADDVFTDDASHI